MRCWQIGCCDFQGRNLEPWKIEQIGGADSPRYYSYSWCKLCSILIVIILCYTLLFHTKYSSILYYSILNTILYYILYSTILLLFTPQVAILSSTCWTHRPIPRLASWASRRRGAACRTPRSAPRTGPRQGETIGDHRGPYRHVRIGLEVPTIYPAW